MRYILIMTLLLFACDGSEDADELCYPGGQYCVGDNLYKCNMNSQLDTTPVQSCGENKCWISDRQTTGDHCVWQCYDCGHCSEGEVWDCDKDCNCTQIL